MIIIIVLQNPSWKELWQGYSASRNTSCRCTQMVQLMGPRMKTATTVSKISLFATQLQFKCSTSWVSLLQHCVWKEAASGFLQAFSPPICPYPFKCCLCRFVCFLSDLLPSCPDSVATIWVGWRIKPMIWVTARRERRLYLYTCHVGTKDTGNSLSKEKRRKWFKWFCPEELSQHQEFPGRWKPAVH